MTVKSINFLEHPSPKVMEAAIFADEHHRGQQRKYEGGDYIQHPFRVAATMASLEGTTTQLLVALLHDTVEDTPVTLADIDSTFGVNVMQGVMWLTNTPRKDGQNRAQRVVNDVRRLKQAPDWVKAIKLADRLDNMSDIIEMDPKFAKVFMKESRLVVVAVKSGSAILYEKAMKVIDDYYEENPDDAG